MGYELAGSWAVFQGRFKLMQNLDPKETGDWELYDIKADPSELHDLSGDMPDRVAEMRAFFEAYAKEVNFVPVPEGYNWPEQRVINAKRNTGH